MRLSEFDFTLPGELIAQAPLPRRADSRLLALGREGPRDLHFRDLPVLLRPGDVLVLNDTRVVRARFLGEKDTGGKVEVLVERTEGEREALAQVRASHAPRPGSRMCLEGALDVEVVGRESEFFRLRFPAGTTVAEAMEGLGRVPLPPYIERTAGAEDTERYQTVFARAPGSVAAPTAGLHFDEAMLARLRGLGLVVAPVTLHVGAGTFQPVRVDDPREHRMHSERYEIPESTAAAVSRAKAEARRVLAVGTTALRALESAWHGSGLLAGPGETRLFILPGYRFAVVDCLLTNFHLPRSTLLMLACAFGGHERVLAAYRHAVALRYRFFSYGDAMFMERQEE